MGQVRRNSRARGFIPMLAVLLVSNLLVSAGAEATNKLENAYARWVARHEAASGGRNVVLKLGWSKAYSSGFSSAVGTATLDPLDGSVRVEVQGLRDEARDVWLIDNVPGGERGAAPDAGDEMLFLGSLESRGGVGVLLANAPLDRFDVDAVAVTRPGETPVEGGVLFGSPGLWQRRYTQARRGFDRFRRGRRYKPRRVSDRVPVPTSDALVLRGADLFFNETFDGNGRTCGTCHPAVNNFTIDPKFIARLRDDDPLFVAEFNPALAENFEKPVLMRQLGLILENTNGFENPASNFTMRSVPHTLGLSVTITPNRRFPLENATGWSGDGAPSGGSLRQFANGAIRQHFPRSTDRIENVDFRFATDEELDAMEAFQLFLGREEDPDITPGSPTELVFRSPLVERGKMLFNDTDTADGTAGKCVSCHSNAGATALSSGTNDNVDTGFQNLPNNPADFIVAAVGDPNLADNPDDDGFGNPGDGTFNTPPLVEAADTAPFFHNNAVETLEEAIDFYNSDAFAESPAGENLASARSGEMNGIGIRLEKEQVVAVAALLRVLNSLENIRSATETTRFARGLRSSRGSRGLLRLAKAEIADAVEVLAAGRLHPKARRELRRARQNLARAVKHHRRRVRGRLLVKALYHLREARDLMLL